MYIKIVYLFSFSMLFSFCLAFYLKRLLISPESDFENFLYERCSLLKQHPDHIYLDFEVYIKEETVHVNVLGLLDTYYFEDTTDDIYEKFKKKFQGKKATVSIVDNKKNSLFTKNYSKVSYMPLQNIL